MQTARNIQDGIASPNPSYPQNIEVVTGTQEVKVENVNLLSEDDITIQALNIIGERPKYIEVGNKVYRTIITELKAGTYTLSLSQNFWFTRQCINDVVSNVSQLTNNYTFTLLENSIFEISFRKENSTEFENTDFTAQIEKSSTSTTYTPHAEQTQTISLGDIELCKIGNYQDYLYKSNDKWYKKEYIGKTIFNGSQNFEYINSIFFRVMEDSLLGSGINVKSNYLSGANSQGNTTDVMNNNADNSICAGSSGQARFYIKCSTFTSVSSFKTWLETHNLTTYYVLNTPQDIEITQTNLIEQLNNLEKLMSYNGTTNISSSGNLAMVLSVSALKGE